VEGDVPIDNDALLVTDFMNLNIKSTQSFKSAYRSRVCVHRDGYSYIYEYMYLYYVFKKDK
jgi:hypothetical protein